MTSDVRIDKKMLEIFTNSADSKYFKINIRPSKYLQLTIYLLCLSTLINLLCISAGKLHKKWRSTSDFDPAPALSVYRKNTTGAAAVTGSSLRNRRPSVTLCLHIDFGLNFVLGTLLEPGKYIEMEALSQYGSRIANRSALIYAAGINFN